MSNMGHESNLYSIIMRWEDILLYHERSIMTHDKSSRLCPARPWALARA